MYSVHLRFEEAQRSDAQKEIEDFLKSNPAYAQQAMVYSVRAGAALAAENPALAQQGLQAAFAQSSPATSGPHKGYAKL